MVVLLERPVLARVRVGPLVAGDLPLGVRAPLVNAQHRVLLAARGEAGGHALDAVEDAVGLGELEMQLTGIDFGLAALLEHVLLQDTAEL